ncbi:MAG: LamG domain-containing protein [Bauldia sp.]|nr:LamG domain-containing protein [Bauldia sp.]
MPVGTGATGGSTAPAPDNGLVGYWRFDGSPADASGHRNAGTVINASFGRGRVGKALDLTGSDDSHVTVRASPSLGRMDRRITVAAWVFPRTLPNGFRVVASRQIAALMHPDQFYLGFGTQHGTVRYKWHVGTTEGGKTREASIYAGAPEPGHWVHLAGVYDGRTITLYIDGRAIGHQPTKGRIPVDDNPVTIGAEENGPVPFVVENELDGRIDEVRLYDRALSAREIRALYKGTRGGADS